MPRLILVLLATLVSSTPALAQSSLWSDVSESGLRPAPGTRITTPSDYRVVRLDVPAMASRLDAAPKTRDGLAAGESIAIPLPEGGFVDVRVAEASILAPALQAKYPEIRTYLADGEGSIRGRLSFTPEGFRGMLFTPGGMVYVDPYARGDRENYVVYYSRDLEIDPSLRGKLDDEVLIETEQEAHRQPGQKAANGATLRTYRLAVAATGEYTAVFGGTVAQGMAAITTTMNRVTGIYENDLSVSFQLVANNDQVVYTNGSTDPYSNSNPSALLNENQANLDAVIGSANYDVGHVFTTGGGGLASLGVICNNSAKARGETGLPNPVGDAFDVDFVAHEIGHQFSGNHTFNGDSGNCAGGNRNGPTAYEPGSGSTIQAYAGICGNDNLQNNSDAYFHGVSLDEMTAHITVGSGSTCGTTVPTGNTIPSVTVPGNYTIPADTPFALTGSATDDTPNSLTYVWEEFDLGPQADVNAGTIPLFRSFTPTASPTRYFPQLDRLVDGLPPVIGETLPSGGETLTFRLTARDNRAGGGAINDASLNVSVVDTGAPFEVTFASTAGQSFGSSATITWNVAGTDANGINAANVDILFSDNDGASFDYVLAPGTPNDGSQVVSFPVATSQGRILVRGTGNVFFNVNAEAFSTTSANPSILAASPGSFSSVVPLEGTDSGTLTLSNTASTGASDLNFSIAVEYEDSAKRQAALDAARANPPVQRPKGWSGDAGTGIAGKLAGGPDAFGYTFADSDEPGGPSVSFQDISGTGTAVTFTVAGTFGADDEGYADFALPFTFSFYGTDYSSVRVFTNGFVTFTSLTGNTFNTSAIPSATAPNALIAPFWDDLDLSSFGTAYTGTLPDGRFVVQYDGVPRWNQTAVNTFQILLSDDGTIEFQYESLSGNLTSATVGIENASGSDGLQVVRNGAWLASNKAVRFTPPVPPLAWLSASPTSGSVAPDASASVVVSIDAAGLAEGTYEADLVISSNDPDTPTLLVPVTLIVGGATAAESIDGEAGWRLFAPAAPGMTIADLGELNRLSGIPGYDEINDPGGTPESVPNIFTEFDGTALLAPSLNEDDEYDPLQLGKGFWWYLYDVNFSDDTPSDSSALPFTLATSNAPTTSDVPVTLHADGLWKVNMLGNPFGQSLDLSTANTWQGRTNLRTPNMPVFAIYDSGSDTPNPNGNYVYSTDNPVITAWQGFYAYGKTVGTLTIPASARTTGGTLLKNDDRVFLSLHLAEEVSSLPVDRQPMTDRGAVLYFDEEASAGEDPYDLAELTPMDASHVTLAYGGLAETGETVLRGHEGRSPSEGAFTVPLHVRSVGASNTLTLTWPSLHRLPSDWRVTLRDVETGASLDLREHDRYTFEVDAVAVPALKEMETPRPATEVTTLKSQDVPVRFELTVLPSAIATADEGDPGAALTLSTPEPNPSRNRATVRFSLAEAGDAVLTVYDVQGREVARLSEGARAAGAHEVTWATGDLASGVYVLRLVAGERVLTQRAVVAR